MSLHHRIWELVTMICHPRGQDTAATRQLTDNGETVISGPQTDETVAAGAKKEQEAEISRLTWAVLDGTASNAERLRLAELMSAQHAERGARNQQA